jgi:excisionase family DNA binding protein
VQEEITRQEAKEMPRVTERETSDAKEAAARLGVAIATIYRAAKRGELDAIRVGRRVLIRNSSLHRLLGEKET